MTQTHGKDPADARAPEAEEAGPATAPETAEDHRRAASGPGEHETRERAQTERLSGPGRLALPPAFCLIRLR